MHTDYRSSAIRELRDEQVQTATRQQQLDQAERAEQLLDELDPERSYPYSLVYRRIANGAAQAGELGSRNRIAGNDVRHDLRLFVEDISDAAAVPADAAGERVLTVEELSKMLDVSTKTISRWRRQGLIGRRFVVDGRKRVGFLQSSVEKFIAQNNDKVRRSSRFRQMTDHERRQIVETARRLFDAGYTRPEVAKRVAERMDRSLETVRSAIRQYDRQNPERAVFPSSGAPLCENTRTQIYRQYRRGESVDSLAKRYSRTKTTIYRAISEMRLAQVMELPLDFIPNAQFPRVRNDEAILAPLPEPEVKARKTRAPSGLPPYLASLYEVPLLTREQEYHLFRKFNFAKYRASKLREKLDPKNPEKEILTEIERLYDIAVETKNLIVRSNLRLVVSIAKRHAAASENFFELVSDGNMSLIRAAEKFDFARGNKFSTYASWAIMKNFARTIPGELRHRDRFRTSYDEMFGVTEERRSDWYEQESAHRQRVGEIEKILRRLDEREQKIIINRFGLDHSVEPQTLKEVGEVMGVTKERVRQIEARALNKLRAAAIEERIDLPEAS
ncbi:MAG: helix-turn-helix domain-containing protein [Planctomycetota bacterium]|nr:MAG: helix-turn-helix domain-containing protein [Planctomycetota bacterium]REJ97192.1 MAG: helix-turn-helix domain-containing protein [Planctomycetota bacterium]REK28001.1 MAG: helix-turn-helix domain-containing protein [Planctomycetota bacterium]REK48682.1 MAG: helix-turn-helix domain-containing protein [Planctomycetota bacterium]